MYVRGPMADSKPSVQVGTPDPNVRTATGAHTALVAIGVLLLLAWVGLLVANRSVGSETEETTVPATQQAAVGTTGATGTTGSAALQPTTKTTKTKELASETLLSALLGASAALILVGFLYGRISSIKLPGGTELGFLVGNLTEDEKKTTAKKVADAMPSDASNEQVAEATIKATTKVAQEKATRQTQALATDITEVPAPVIDAAVAEVTPS